MNVDFTIAVQPELTSIDKELQYIKSALLYADKIVLISPMVYMYTQLTSGGAVFDEKQILKLMKFILPMCKEREPETYRKGKSVVEDLSRIIYSKQYKAIPLVHKIELRKQIKVFMQEMDEKFLEMMGEEQTAELNLLLKSGKLVLQKFEHNCYNANRPGEARQPGVLFSYSRLSYNGREIGLTRLLMDYPCPAAKQSAILPL